MKPTSILWVVLFCLGGLIADAQNKSEYGQVIDSIQCDGDSSQTYALYVPSYYSAQSKWPVIFVFEPAARGPLPVRQYKKVAEELGYLIIASNNSKNGSWPLSLAAAEAIFKDGTKKFNLDSSRIYTSGFSGGSRVAVTLAVLNPEVEGVIGCGAGLSGAPRYQPHSANNFVYVGMVGNRDMNYLEHLELENKFDLMGISNNRIVFSAGHQWPSPNQLREAVYWLDLQAVKKDIEVSAAFEVDVLYEMMEFRADSLAENERYVQALHVYDQMVADFEGLLDVSSINQKIEIIEGMKQLKKYVKRDERLNERERKYQIKIDENFSEIRRTKLAITGDSTVKTKKWWFQESDSLRSVTKSKNVDKSNSGHRSLNLIWAKFAAASFNYATNKDYQTAIALNEVWIYTDPNNVWGLWSMAKLQAQSGNADEALDYLYKAHDAGMKYRGSLKIAEFDALRENPRFISLEEKLIYLQN